MGGRGECRGRAVRRVALIYEAGRDGFWIARYLLAQGVEVQVVHPASIPVERPGRRVKTDRIDLDMLLRTFLAWLRGEPRVCSMVRIPSAAEEEMRRPGRERERLVSERLQLENRIENLLCLHGIAGFRPRLKKAVERLEALRSFAGLPLPGKTMAGLRRLMARHALLCEQLQWSDNVDEVLPHRAAQLLGGKIGSLRPRVLFAISGWIVSRHWRRGPTAPHFRPWTSGSFFDLCRVARLYGIVRQ
jgi:hypothetical protein